MSNWPVWHTCQNCPPHGMADHSIYGDRACLINDCLCKCYKADKNKPIIRDKKAPRIDTPLPDKPF